MAATSLSASTALTKRPSSSLMLPPPPPKRIKRPATVLDEDTYTSSLSHIIARDFFPGLLESETQQEYLDALDSKDQAWIDEAEARVRAMMTPGPESRRMRGRRGVSMTPLSGLHGSAGDTPLRWAGETPRTQHSTPRTRSGPLGEGASEIDQINKPDLNLSLSAFQAKYTSEDNESFNALLDQQNAKRAEKYSYLWNGNKLPSKQAIAQADREQRLLAAANSQSKEGPVKSTALALLRHERSSDTRKAMVDVRPPRPRNGFMFTPDDLETTHPEHQSRHAAAQVASNAPPKAVAFDNTRLPVVLSPDDSIPQSPSLSAIDAAIAGHPRPRGPLSSVANSDVAGTETPRVNGYAFVDEEPTPSEIEATRTPDQDATDRSTALLASLQSHNQLISPGGFGATASNPFSIAPASARESLHHRLVAKTNAAHAAVAKRTSSRSATPVATPSATPLTPAQRRAASLAPRSSVNAGRTPTPAFASSPRFPKGEKSAAARGKKAAGGLTPAAWDLYGKIRGGVAARTDKSAPELPLGDAGAFDEDTSRARKRQGVFTPVRLGARKVD